MLEYKGKYASCLVMLDEIEATAVQQIYGFLNCPAFEGAKIRIMPDVHAGAGAVIGFTSTLTDKVIPNVIGVDIGCGVLSHNLGKLPIDFPKLDEFIRKNIPSGFSVNDHIDTEVKKYDEVEGFSEVAKETEQDQDRVLKSLGSLGGGNHFIEVGQDQDGNKWLTIHSGSRNFGLKIANWHQKIAKEKLGAWGALAWLEGKDASNYLEHMKIAQNFALWNRSIMAVRIMDYLYKAAEVKPESYMSVESTHNYIDFLNGIIRKGAISAITDEAVIIPWNMRDGLIIGWGKGNPEWNYSAPHGAGRVMGRGAAKKTLDVEDFKASMDGIWTSCVGKGTLDEAPMVYKDYHLIQDAINDTVEIEHTVKPLYNFKAGEE